MRATIKALRKPQADRLWSGSKPTANLGLASCGVTCKLGALCFYSSSVQVDSFVLRNPPERKARKRYAQV
jgi:hypothetical protein